MVDYSVIVPAVVFLVIAVVAFKVIKSAVNAAITVAAITAIALGAAAFLVVMDANDLRENFGSEENLFLLVDGGEVISGIEFHGEGEPGIVSGQQLEEYSEIIGSGSVEEAGDEYYKVIVIDAAVFESGSIDSGLDVDSIRDSAYVEERAELFAPAIEEIFSDPVLLVEEYKEGNVRVYDESPVFKAIKLIPASFMREVAERFIAGTKEVVEDAVEE